MRLSSQLCIFLLKEKRKTKQEVGEEEEDQPQGMNGHGLSFFQLR